MKKNLPIKSYVAKIVGGEGEECIFSSNRKRKYVVPVYQRPYSWEERNIDDFLQTIMEGFNNNRELKFFGTMQFNVEKKDDSPEEYQIVDGQQRITTVILLAKVLEGITKENILEKYGFSLVMKNDANANRDFKMILDADKIGSISRGNKGKTDLSNISSTYDSNIRMLNYKFVDYFNDCDKSRFANIEVFAKEILHYFLSGLYVVVLETNSQKLRLAEIVSIFNTINTTGMALDDSDIFKLQYFDYLRREYPQQGDLWMDKINECYERIDDYNHNKPNKKKIGISWALDIYKHSICTYYGMKFEYLSKSNERFFEDIFKKPSVYKEMLRYEVFYCIVDIFVEFWEKIENNDFQSNKLHALSVKIIEHTRYGRYWTIPFVYMFFYMKDTQIADEQSKKALYERALENSYAVSRLFVVNSVNFAKVINPVQGIMCNKILPMIKEKQDVINYIDEIIWESPYENEPKGEFLSKQWFISCLERDTFENTNVGLVCLLLAVKREIDIHTSLEQIIKLLFNWEENPYDIEHIYSRSEFMKKEHLTEDEKGMCNGIGNLVVLERSINREMGREHILLPLEKAKTGYYEKTNFCIAKDLCEKLPTWDINPIEQRMREQVRILVDMLSAND